MGRVRAIWRDGRTTTCGRWRTPSAALANDLADLGSARWRHDTLRGEWDVEQVVAHLTAIADPQLRADDGPFATGTGPPVTGSTLALVMSMAGRTPYLAELDGPGEHVAVITAVLTGSADGLLVAALVAGVVVGAAALAGLMRYQNSAWIRGTRASVFPGAEAGPH
jgi:hypothetical protein